MTSLFLFICGRMLTRSLAQNERQTIEKSRLIRLPVTGRFSTELGATRIFFATQ